MKIIEFKKYENIPEIKKINKRKLGFVIGVVSVLVTLLIILGIYVGNRNFREFMDKYVLRKSVKENTLPFIEFENTQNVSVIAYDKYVAILEKNRLKHYNSTGNQVSDLEINISNPVFETNEKYLLVAENLKQKLYLVYNSKLNWEKSIEGKISRISVNKNGYVSIIVSGTTYKSVIITYDNTGKEIFKTYLSTTNATNLALSNDNKYMSFAEIDTTGSLIQYKIKTVDIDSAKQSPEKAIIKEYVMELDQLVIDMKYQEKNRLSVMCNDGVWILADGNKDKIIDYKENLSKISFGGIQLNNAAFRVEEIIYGALNQASNVEITSTVSNRKSVYTINGAAKEVKTKDNIISVNLGAEVYFIRTNGWLAKKYISTQEVKSTENSGEIAAIIYRDKIEFLGL